MNDSELKFNGQRLDPVSGNTHLGNGYRAYNPVLMRMNSPDSWSPFGTGGINTYAYCTDDPVNRSDPSGHMSAQGWTGFGLGMLTGIAGVALSVFTGGTSLAAAIAVATSLSTAALDLASGLIENKDPKAAAIMSWTSQGIGIIGGLAEGAIVNLSTRGVENLASETILASSYSRRGLDTIMDQPSMAIEHRRLDGYLPHGFRFLGRSPGFKRGGEEMWLDYSFYDYINGDLRLNVASHGDSIGMKTARIRLPESGNNAFTGSQAFDWLHNNNFILQGNSSNGRVSRVRFLMCGGANAKTRSFAQNFANASHLPTSSWQGDLWLKGPLEQELRVADLEQGTAVGDDILQARGTIVVASAMSTGDLLQTRANCDELMFQPLK